MNQRQLSRRARKRSPTAKAVPLLITAATGSLYSLLLEQGIDAFWLLKIHTGNFGVLNLQPFYPMLLGAHRHRDSVGCSDAHETIAMTPHSLKRSP